MPIVKKYYAPTMIDESMTRPDRKGRQHPTGNLSGMVFGRKFTRYANGKIKAERLVISFSWAEDTPEAKAAAVANVIDGMEELSDLDSNPPINWIPDFVKSTLKQEADNAVLRS